MSFKATAWAWEQPVPPVQKIVLLALADSASNTGECWPGLAHLILMTGLSRRGLQLQLQALHAAGLLDIVPRNRPDGGRSSHLYCLRMQGKTTSDTAPPSARDAPTPRARRAPPPVHGVHPPRAPETPPPVHGVHPQRASARARTGQLNQSFEPEADAHARARKAAAGTAAADEPSARTEKDAWPAPALTALHWPERLTAPQRTSIVRRLNKAGLEVAVAQDVLDVLAVRLTLPAGVAEPGSYVAALIRRQQAGTLETEDAAPIRAARQARARADAQAEASRTAASPTPAAAAVAPRTAAPADARAALKRAARGAPAQEEDPS